MTETAWDLMVFKPVVEWKRIPAKWIAAVVLAPAAALYGLITLSKSALYRARILRSAEGPLPVIGVGSCSVGGTGKTPVAQYLSLELYRRGIRAGFVSTGYGRRSDGFRLVSDGTRLHASVEEAGDEAYMVAHEFLEAGACIPVAVDRNRFRAMEKLREAASVDAFVMDDILQFRKLQCDVEVVVQDYFERSYPNLPIPVGRLRDWPFREGPRQIRIVSKAPVLESSSRIHGRVGEFVCQYEPASIFNVYARRHIEWSDLAGRDIVLLAGLGHHEAFLETLKRFLLLYNARVFRYIEFQDHHWYTARDFDRVARIAGPDRLILTTHKDAVKIRTEWLGPAAKRFCVVRSQIRFKPAEEEIIVASILQVIRNRPNPAKEGPSL